MKNDLLLRIFFLFAVFAASGGTVKAEDVSIGSKSDWDAFAARVNNGETSLNATLTADITDAITTMAGTATNPYCGTFNGDGHSMVLNITNDGSNGTGLFKYTGKGAAITGLTLSGAIAANDYKFAGSIVGDVGNTTALTRCYSTVTITSTVNGDGTHGGLAGVATNVTMTDCGFSGAINGSETTSCGGLLGWAEGKKAKFNNCYVAAAFTVGTSNSCTIARNASADSIKNCYYLNALGDDVQGTQKDSASFASGEVAYLLQNSRTDMVWGQTIGTDKLPLLTTDATKKVYQVAYKTESGTTMTAQYANMNGTVTLLDADSKVFNNYNLSNVKYYMNNTEVTGSVTITSDTIVVVKGDNILDGSGTAADPCLISTISEYNKFAGMINNGYTSACARLTADITDAVTTMAGTANYPYCGTFDGNGHSMVLNITNDGSNGTGLFKYTGKGAAITDLTLSGGVVAGSKCYAGSIVGYANDTIALTRCYSTVTITSTSDQASCAYHGGLAGAAKNMTMTDCGFAGAINCNATDCISGLLGGAEGKKATFSNCYVAATFGPVFDCTGTIAYDVSTDNIKNCYYLNALGDVQGTQKDSASFASGEVAYLLQNSRTDMSWGQTIGTDKLPLPTTDDTKKVYKITYQKEDGTEITTEYANNPVTLQDMQKYRIGDATLTLNGSTITGTTATVSADAVITVKGDVLEGSGTAADPYQIETLADYNSFAYLVNNGDTSVCAKLTADITDAVTTMAGTSTYPYCGTFNGNGHTMNLAITNDGSEGTGLFKYTGKGAAITDLTLSGTVAAKSYKYAGSIVGQVNDTTTLTHCYSTVTITSTFSGDGIHGGLAGEATNVTMTDCGFAGAINGSSTTSCGGLLGWANNKKAKFNNCYVAAAFTVGTSNSRTISRNASADSIKNCYYLNALGTVQGTAATAAEFANGSILDSLGTAWAQTIGTDTLPTPCRASMKGTKNYVYNDGTDFVCDDFEITDGDTVDIGLDFTAKALTCDRTFKTGTEDGLYTMYAPFSIPAGNGTFYTCTGVNEAGTEATLTEVSGATSANVAYVFKPAVTALPTLTDVAVKATTDIDQSASKLKGCYEMFTFTDDNSADCYGYAAQSYGDYTQGQFVPLIKGATVPPMRAYLYAPTAAANAQCMDIVFEDADGNTTGVGRMTDGTVTVTDGVVYNLQGMRVAENTSHWNMLPNGVYVVNSKKIIKR